MAATTAPLAPAPAGPSRENIFAALGWLTHELRLLARAAYADVVAADVARADQSLAGMAAASIELQVHLTQAMTLNEALRETLRKHMAREAADVR